MLVFTESAEARNKKNTGGVWISVGILGRLSEGVFGKNLGEILRVIS